MSDPTAGPSASTHLDAAGNARMVDVSDKHESDREAVACARVRMSAAAVGALAAGSLPKGDAPAVARVAGIQAAKRTAEWIPLCHQLPLAAVSIEIEPNGAAAEVLVRATARARARTGVEMEALVAASAAALTLYDMVKGIDRAVVIEEIRLESKRGGRSGAFLHPRAAGAHPPASPAAAEDEP